MAVITQMGWLLLGLGAAALCLSGWLLVRGARRSVVAASPHFVAAGRLAGLGRFRGRLQALSVAAPPLGRDRIRLLVADDERRSPLWVELDGLDTLTYQPTTATGETEPGGAGVPARRANGPTSVDRPAAQNSVAASPGAGGPVERAARAFGYLFVEAAAPERLEGTGERLAAACRERGWTMVGMVCDKEDRHRKRLERPALDHALERLAAGDADLLLVARLEHLCRSASELAAIAARLATHNTRLVCLEPAFDTATSAGANILAGLQAISAWERQRLAQRTRKGLAAARGSRPTLADRPELKHQIQIMRDQGMTLQAIADELNEQNIPTLRGGSEWRPSSVQAAVGYKRPDNTRTNGPDYY